MIFLKGVTRTFLQGTQEIRVLSDLDLEVAAGDFVTIRGVSGSGKSTLLHLLAGLDLPESGSIVVDGAEITALDLAARTRYRRETMGMIFQFYNLIPTLTARENVLLALEILDQGGGEGRERADRVLSHVGLEDFLDSYPQELSGGQQQRVAIARALVKNPPLLLADEPTGNLDEETGRRVMELIQRVGKEYNTTTVVVTHDPDVAAMGGRRYHLHGGRLNEVP